LKRIYRIAAKIVLSGIIGLLLFILSIYSIGFILPASDHMDVVEGWAAGFLMIMGVACSMFLSGAIAMMLSYKDISSSLDILSIPFFSGLVTAIIPFMILILLGSYAIDLFYIGLLALLICLILSLLGGLLTYVLMNLLGKIRKYISGRA
jgi:hypothetical protein